MSTHELTSLDQQENLGPNQSATAREESSTSARPLKLSPQLDAKFYTPSLNKTEQQESLLPIYVDRQELMQIIEDDSYQQSQLKPNVSEGASQISHRYEMSPFLSVIGALLLVSSIFGGSFIGVISNFVPARNNFVQLAQRAATQVLFFLIPAVVQGFCQRNSIAWAEILCFRFIFVIVGSALLATMWTFGLNYCSQHMIQSHAYVMCNLHGLVILLINFGLGIKPVKDELIGFGLALIGCICMVADPTAVRADGQSGSFLTYLFALFASIIAGVYFLVNARNVTKIPICILIFSFNFVTLFLFYLIGTVLEPGKIKIFSTNAEWGVFGFFDPNYFVLLFVLQGFFSGFLGNSGYTLALLFYSPVVTTTAFLIEPLCAQALGFAFGLDKMPGALTFIGTILAVVGIFYLQRGGNNRKENESSPEQIAEKSQANQSYVSDRWTARSQISMDQLSGRRL